MSLACPNLYSSPQDIILDFEVESTFLGLRGEWAAFESSQAQNGVALHGEPLRGQNAVAYIDLGVEGEFRMLYRNIGLDNISLILSTPGQSPVFLETNVTTQDPWIDHGFRHLQSSVIVAYPTAPQGSISIDAVRLVPLWSPSSRPPSNSISPTPSPSSLISQGY